MKKLWEIIQGLFVFVLGTVIVGAITVAIPIVGMLLGVAAIGLLIGLVIFDVYIDDD